MSVVALAELMGVSRNAVHRWESGTDTPSDDRLGPLAEALQVSVGELLGAAGPETTKPAPLEGGLGAEEHSAEWWSGFQRATLRMMEHAAAMNAEAIQMQREIVSKTRPEPLRTRDDLTPEQAAQLATARSVMEAVEKARREQDAAANDAPPARSGASRGRRQAG